MTQTQQSKKDLRNIDERASAAPVFYGKYYSRNLGPVVDFGGREVIMMGAVNYLGLSHHPDVLSATIRAVEEHGAAGLGSMYSNGCLEIHEELERGIKEFIGKESCAFFNSGYMANLGAFSAFGPDALVFSDKENHLSIYDACRLSGLNYYRFKHNDSEHLEHMLSQFPKAKNKWVVLVGTFGVTGENIKLAEITEVAKRHGAKIYLDDAHAIGIFGDQKRGLSEHFGILEEIDLIMTSFQMAFGNVGAFVAGPPELVDKIKLTSRPYIFTYGLQAHTVSALLSALAIIRSQEGNKLVARLFTNAGELRKGLKGAGFSIISKDSQIVSIRTGDEFDTAHFANEALDQGLWVQKYVHPAVALGQAVVRLTCMASHSDEHIRKTVQIMADAGKKHHLL